MQEGNVRSLKIGWLLHDLWNIFGTGGTSFGTPEQVFHFENREEFLSVFIGKIIAG
jgi:hypothetical protein